MMANTWKGAKAEATKMGVTVVYHDYDTGEYGAVPQGHPIGHHDEWGQFHKHNCLYLPAYLSSNRMYEKEQMYLMGYTGEEYE